MQMTQQQAQQVTGNPQGQRISTETPLENADYKFFVSEEDDNNKNRQSGDVITTLSTVKGMLSTQRQQTCTEAVEKIPHFTVYLDPSSAFNFFFMSTLFEQRWVVLMLIRHMPHK